MLTQRNPTAADVASADLRLRQKTRSMLPASNNIQAEIDHETTMTRR